MYRLSVSIGQGERSITATLNSRSTGAEEVVVVVVAVTSLLLIWLSRLA